MLTLAELAISIQSKGAREAVDGLRGVAAAGDQASSSLGTLEERIHGALKSQWGLTQAQAEAISGLRAYTAATMEAAAARLNLSTAEAEVFRVRSAMTKQMFAGETAAVMAAAKAEELARASTMAFTTRMRAQQVAQAEAAAAAEVAAAASVAKAEEVARKYVQGLKLRYFAEQQAATLAAEQAAISSAARVAAAQEAFLAKITRMQAIGAKGNIAALTFDAKALGIEGAAAPMLAELAKVEKAAAASGGGISNLSIRVREFFVMIREFVRGDMTRLLGSASIEAQAFGLFGAGAIGATAAVAGLAVAVGILIFAIVKAQGEIAKINNALLATNNAVGLTTGQIQSMGKEIAAATHTGVSGAIKELTSLAATGEISGTALGLVGDATIRLSQLTGQSADKIGKELVKSFDDATKGAIELNNHYHFLTLAQYDEIEALQRAGDKQGAFNLLMTDLDGHLKTITPAMGTFEKAWHAITNAIDGTIRALGHVGVAMSNAEALAKAKAQVQKYEAIPGGGLLYGAKIADLNREISGRSIVDDFDQSTAKQEAKQDLISKAAIDSHVRLLKENPKFGGSAARAAEEVRIFKEDISNALKGNPQDEQALDAQDHMADRIKAIYKKYDRADQPHHQRADPIQTEIDRLTAEAQGNLQVAEALDTSTAAGFRATAMRRALIDAARLHTDATKFEALELNVALTAGMVQNAKYVEGLVEKISTQGKVNDLMALSGSSQSTANKMVSDAAELDKIAAEMANAKGSQYAKLAAQYREVKDRQLELNKTQAEALAIQAAAAQNDEGQRLALELKLIGATNRERASELAMLKEKQRIVAEGLIFNPRSAGLITAAGASAGRGADVTTATNNYNKSLSYQLDLLTQIDSMAKTAGADMAASFGKMGQAISNVITTLAGYAKLQESIEVKRRADVKASLVDGKATAETAHVNQLADNELAFARIKNYGDMAGAAASFFGKNTALYKAATAIQQVYHIVELAMAFESMAAKTAAAGVDATTTAASVANSGLRATADGIAAFAKTIASLPFPFNLAAGALVAATLISAGVSMFGGGAKGTVADTTAVDRQKIQSTGSVLGDPTGTSKSIANALALAQANQNTDLQYSSQMVTSLRSIDSNISTLTAALARSLNVGGALDPSKLGLGTSTAGPSGGQTVAATILGGAFGFALTKLLPGLFGAKTTTTLQDQGLTFTPQTVGQIVASGIQGSSYNQIAAETQKKFLGITYSDKTKVSTTSTPLSSEVAADITRIIASLETGVLSAANILGIKGAKATLEALTLNLGTISLKGLTGTALTDAINAVFSKAGDDMAAAVLPMIDQFQKAGEGAFETLVRLATDYQTVDVTLQSIGKTFGAVGVASIAAREKLIGMVGGISNLTQLTSAFATAFLTPAQQLAPIQKAVAAEMLRLGQAAVTTKTQFANLVLGIDTSTEAGATLYAALLSVAPAFAKVADAAVTAATDLQTAANNDVATATQALTSAYQAQSTALQTTIDKLRTLAATLATFRNGLDLTTSLNPVQSYAAAKAAFAVAKQGDGSALPGAGQAFIDASKNYQADSIGYLRDIADVKVATQAAEAAANAQADAAQAQLSALTNQVQALIDIKVAVQDVGKDIVALQAALLAQKAANAGVSLATNGATPTPANGNSHGTFDAASYLAKNPDVAAAYAGYLAGPQVWAPAGYGLNDTLAQFAADHYRTVGQAAGRQFALGGVFTNGVVSQPTLFNPARMGEAGPEAIMPLTRGPNGLGVRGSNDNGALLAEMRAQRADNRAAASAMAAALIEMTKTQRKWDGDGLPATRTGT